MLVLAVIYRVLPREPPQARLPTVSGTLMVPRCFPSAGKDPNAARPRAVDVALLIDFHAVRSPGRPFHGASYSTLPFARQPSGCTLYRIHSFSAWSCRRKGISRRVKTQSHSVSADPE